MYRTINIKLRFSTHLEDDGEAYEGEERNVVLVCRRHGQQRLELGDVGHHERHVHQLVDEVPLTHVHVRVVRDVLW